MSDITKGETFTGVAPGNEVTAERLNNLLDAASIHISFLTGKTAETSVADGDYFLFFDASDNAFKKVQKQHLVPTVASILTGHRKLVIFNTVANPNTQLDVTADEIVMRDDNGDMRRTLAFSQTVDIAVYAAPASVNGRDFSGEAANTWYYVWAISDATNDRLLLSSSATAPTMPTDYTYKCFLGAVRNDNSSNFIKQRQVGNEVTCQEMIPTAHGVDFTAISASVAGTFETVTLSACIPPSIVATVTGYLGTASTSTNLRAIVASSAAGTDAAPTAGTVYGWTPVVMATSGVTIGGLAGAAQFRLPIRSSQTISWTSQGAATQTMRITGYSLNGGG